MILKSLKLFIFISAFALGGAASAETMKGVCAVSASVHGGKKFATLKCYKASQPGDYKIRSTVWEKDDREGFRKLSRFAGRRFSCNLTNTGTTRDTNIEYSHYKLENCR